MRIRVLWNGEPSPFDGSVALTRSAVQKKKAAREAAMGQLKKSVADLSELIPSISIYDRMADHVMREEIEKGEWD